MSDIALIWNPAKQAADMSLLDADLATDAGLQTAVTLSLFTDRRAAKDDVLPAGSTDRRGWWGDAVAETAGDQLGSRLWLLRNRTLTQETIALVADYAREALDWLVRDEVASSVTVDAQRHGPETIAMSVIIQRPTGADGRYDYIWSQS